MNVSAVDQSLGSLRSRPNVQQARSDFDQLVQSLQNGNLSAAQQAYADFQRVQASFAPRQSAAPDATNAAVGAAATAAAAAMPPRASQSPVSADWSALGQALQSGNLGQAQNALDKLEGDAQNVWQSHLLQQIQNAQSVYALMQGANQEAMALPTQAGTATGVLSPSVQTDIASLGQSIQSGDSSAAQRLLSQLEQDIKSMSLAAGPTSGHLRDYSSARSGAAGAASGSASGSAGASGAFAANNIAALDGPHPNNIAKVANALSAAGVQSARPIGIAPPSPPTAPAASATPASAKPASAASSATAANTVASAGNAAGASADTHASPKAHAHKPEKRAA